MANKQQIDSTTQKFLDIYDITNNLVILKDGTTSLILTVDAMNFGLLAEEEQDSIMYAYAGLLNSLNYPIQILIKSQTKDVTGYLSLLKEQEDQAVSHTQRHRIGKYREFVSNLIRERNVLDKKFYVVIPAKPLEIGLVPMASVIPGKGATDISTIDKTMIIEKAKSILEPKKDHLIAQFARIGLYSRQLETQEIIQMFYQSYNPGSFEGQHMGDSRSYTAPLVSASIERNIMDNQNNPNQVVAPAPVPATQTPQNIPVTENPVAPAPTTIPTSAPTPEINTQQPAVPTPPNSATTTPSSQPEPVPTPAVAPELNQNIPTTPDITPAPTKPVALAPETPLTTPSGIQEEPIIPSVPNTQTPAYSPTQMNSEPVAPVKDPTTNQVPTPTPTPEQTQTIDNPVATDNQTTPVDQVNQQTITTPPAPELPKTEPGEIDTNINQEVEIKIQHPSEKSVANTADLVNPEKPIGNSMTAESPTNTENSNQTAQDTTPETNGNNAKTMPPLPEIK